MTDLLLSGLPQNSLINTSHLGQVFRKTTNSYKFFWMMAIMNHLWKDKAVDINVDSLLIDMITSAWHPVLLFRLSLGKQDMLQKAVLMIKQVSDLDANSRKSEIKGFINSHSNILNRIQLLGNYVPQRFLTPWFSKKLRGIPDHQKNKLIMQFSIESQSTDEPSVYFFPDKNRTYIRMNPSWMEFLKENWNVIVAFVHYHKAEYLQKRNLNTPNILSKLEPPQSRNLSTPRKFWKTVQNEFMIKNNVNWFKDIYSDKVLEKDYAIDHFCPWSFVAHDHIWNLVPVEPRVNSMKSDCLPNLEYYLPRMAKLHFHSLPIVKCFPSLAEEFIDCYKMDLSSLIKCNQQTFLARMKEIFIPLFSIAQNQGFQTNWRYMV